MGLELQGLKKSNVHFLCLIRIHWILLRCGRKYYFCFIQAPPLMMFQQDRQCACKCNIDARFCNHCCRGKAISITYSVCVCVCVSLSIRHTMHMPHFVICGLPGSTVFFHIMSYTARFSKKFIECEMCLQLVSGTFLFLRTIERDVIKNVYWSSCTQLFLASFNEIWIFSTDLRRIFKHQFSRKSAQ